MKVVYILLAVLIVVGGYYFLAGPPNRVADSNEEQSSEPETVEDAAMPSNEGSEPVPEESSTEPEAELDVEAGADVGMEFPIPDAGVELEPKVFNLDSFNYGYDVAEIRVQEGDTVTVNLSVSEGFHDWVVDEFSAATEKIRPGGFATVTFVADKAGTYEYYCSVGSHRAQGMVGTLIVE